MPGDSPPLDVTFGTDLSTALDQGGWDEDQVGDNGPTPGGSAPPIPNLQPPTRPPLAASRRQAATPPRAPPPPMPDSPWKSPARSRARYGDRFIPSAATSGRLDFSLLDAELAATTPPRRATTAGAAAGAAGQVPPSPPDRDGDSSAAYGALLRAELLGGAGPGDVARELSSRASFEMPGGGLRGAGPAAASGGAGPGGGATAAPSAAAYGLGFRSASSLAGGRRASGGRLPPSPGPSRARRSSGASGRGEAGGAGAPTSTGQAASLSATSPSPSAARRNLFRFSSGGGAHASSGAPVRSPFAIGPLSRTASGGGDPYGVDELGPGSLGARPAPYRIPRAPYKVLDAPRLADDFYLSLIDWSIQGTLAVALGSRVYLWDGTTNKVSHLTDVGPERAITGVAWSPGGEHLAVGTDGGTVGIYDAATCRIIQASPDHTARVGVLRWSRPLLASGSRDRSIVVRDPRARSPAADRREAHRSEVCGLAWSPDGRRLASGGNDNALLVWDAAANRGPMLRFEQHTAAVKAVAWSPHQHGLLASGGGTADRSIRLWSATTGTALGAVDTGSQVCNLAWSPTSQDLVSTHGYSQNQVVVWRYPTMQRLASLTGHTSRVLFLAVSPDGRSVVTGAGDETIRFWKVFPPPRPSAGDGGELNGVRTLIR